MKDCIKLEAETAPLDPRNKVNYAFGMVMGVNDFRQEQEHFCWKHRLGNRLLHGSGTVCGLAISAKAATDGKDVIINVAPGYAISPRGQWIWIKEAQCGLLDAWLQTPLASPLPAAGARRAYVSLRYEECLDELVPISAHACASNEDTQAPSRIVESFQLQFSWQPPLQPAEEAAKEFGDLLQQVEIVPVVSPTSEDDTQAFLDSVKAIGTSASPPHILSPGFAGFRLPELSSCDTLEEALRIWATEVCPRLEDIRDDSLLLAALDFNLDVFGHLVFTLDPQGQLMPGSIGIDERQRPILVSDRLKQELICLIGRGTRYI